jgi:RNA polymerase-binding transcription factor DksA
MDVARRGTAVPHLTHNQLGLLRARLVGALDEKRFQYEQSNALFEAIVGASGDDTTGLDRELARVTAERARDVLDDIEAAVARIDDRTYGACESCGRPIPFERLEAIPHARHCVACPRPSGPLR